MKTVVRTGWVALLLVASLGGGSSQRALAQEPPLTSPLALPNGEPAARLEISLTKSQWQTLPREVSRVAVAPDGRMWYQRGLLTNRQRTLVSLKKELAAEFADAAPQVRDCELLLVEPTGRAWFWMPEQLRLLGYDGKTWIDYVIPDARSFRDRGAAIVGARRVVIPDWQNFPIGQCRTRGALFDARQNVYAGSAAWFIGKRRIYRFDGKNLSRQTIAAKETGVRASDAQTLLAVSPDGQVAAAYAPGEPLWLWRNGQWRQMEPLPPPPADLALDSVSWQGNFIIGLAVPDNNTLWCLFSGGGLVRRALDGKIELHTKLDARIKRLIEDLAADSYVTRQRASKQLAVLGAVAKGPMEAVESKTNDLEQRWRLQSLLRELAARPSQKPTWPFGCVQVGDVYRLYRDDRARVYVMAGSIEDGGHESPGVAMLAPDGSTKVLASNRYTGSARQLFWTPEAPPILTISGNRLWSRLPGGLQTVLLLDFETLRTIDALPLAGAELHAVDGEGRVFVSPSTAFGAAIDVYRPPEANR